MRKTGRKARMEEMSAGRIEYLEAARRRVNNRRLRRTALLVAVVAALVIYLTGLVNTSVMVLEDLADSVRIALMPEQGFPQQTGVGNVYQAESLGGSFVVLGEDGCAVLADSGGRLNTISTGYARPAIAAGKNGFVLYNRSGSELRVESRTREMYTRQTEGSNIPVAITFSCEEEGYELVEYWQPGDGTDYAPDIRAKFPAEAAKLALGDQPYLLQQFQLCYAQAVEESGVDPDVAIEAYLQELASEPSTSSNPQDYLEENPVTHRELTYYGAYTVAYCTAQLAQENQNDLRGRLMQILLNELS